MQTGQAEAEDGGAGAAADLPGGKRARWGSCSAPQAAAGPSRGCCSTLRTRRTCPSARHGQSLWEAAHSREADALRRAGPLGQRGPGQEDDPRP